MMDVESQQVVTQTSVCDSDPGLSNYTDRNLCHLIFRGFDDDLNAAR